MEEDNISYISKRNFIRLIILLAGIALAVGLLYFTVRLDSCFLSDCNVKTGDEIDIGKLKEDGEIKYAKAVYRSYTREWVLYYISDLPKEEVMQRITDSIKAEEQ